MTHVRPLERQWSTPAPGSQPEGNDRGDEQCQPVGSVSTNVGDLRVAQLPVADEARADEDGDTAEQCSQVRLVERVDPMDVGQPLTTADAPPLEQRTLEISVGVGRGNGVQRYSCTSSIRVPKAAFGCTNATVVPREPGRGCWSITWPPWSFTACSASPQSRTR